VLPAGGEAVEQIIHPRTTPTTRPV
jgi:hypothetical protein